MTRILTLGFLVMAGCAGGQIPLDGPGCELTQSAPMQFGGMGTDCVSPAVDGIHAEVSVGNYSVIVTSLDGFALGKHDVMVDQVGSVDAHWTGTMVVSANAQDWVLDIAAERPGHNFVATLSGH